MQYRGLLAAIAVGCGGGDAMGRLADAPDGADAGCVASGPEVCDGVDNDCDGLIDDVDAGGDGIYDCQKVLFLGPPGLRPSADFDAWARGNGTLVTRMVDPNVMVTAELLAPFDLVLIDRISRAYSAEEAAALAAWVNGGGGVMALSGYLGGPSDKDFPNSLVAGLGIGFTGNLLSGPVTTFAADPLTTGLSSVTFAGGFGVAVDAAADRPVLVGKVGAQVVAASVRHGAGRVYLWGDEWVTFDSEWAGSAEIRQFWVDAFGWLGRFR